MRKGCTPELKIASTIQDTKGSFILDSELPGSGTYEASFLCFLFFCFLLSFALQQPARAEDDGTETLENLSRMVTLHLRYLNQGVSRKKKRNCDKATPSCLQFRIVLITSKKNQEKLKGLKQQTNSSCNLARPGAFHGVFIAPSV